MHDRGRILTLLVLVEEWLRGLRAEADPIQVALFFWYRATKTSCWTSVNISVAAWELLRELMESAQRLNQNPVGKEQQIAPSSLPTHSFMIADFRGVGVG